MRGTTDFIKGKRKDDRPDEKVRLRSRANTLLSDPTFVDWAGDVMMSVGFFGEGREMTPYQQGYRGAIVRIFEDLAERADDGEKFLAKVFKEKLKGKAK